MMYCLETANAGKITQIKRLDLPDTLNPSQAEYQKLVTWEAMKDVPVDPSQSAYQQFETWAKSLPAPVDLATLPSGWIFLGVEPLVAFCKHTGIMLHAQDNQGFKGDCTFRPTPNGPLISMLYRSWSFSPARGFSEPASGIVEHPTRYWVTENVLNDLNAAITDESREVRRISSWPIVRTFVYLDVSDFSKYKPGQEALIINSLVNVLHERTLWRGKASTLHRSYEAMMCIGDGYIFVFRDPGRQGWNYIGDGINGGNRVLSAIDKGYDDQVFISGEVRQALMAVSEVSYAPIILANLHNRGRRPDKHGRPWRVYEVAHTALCKDEVPTDV